MTEPSRRLLNSRIKRGGRRLYDSPQEHERAEDAAAAKADEEINAFGDHLLELGSDDRFHWVYGVRPGYTPEEILQEVERLRGELDARFPFGLHERRILRDAVDRILAESQTAPPAAIQPAVAVKGSSSTTHLSRIDVTRDQIDAEIERLTKANQWHGYGTLAKRFNCSESTIRRRRGLIP